jgi:hypothetical protein
MLQESLADRRPRIKRTEDIAAGAVKEAGNGAQDLALCAFPAAGRSEYKVSKVFHGNWGETAH